MSRLGDPSLRGEICFLGVNNEFYNLLPIMVLVSRPLNMAVLRPATWQTPGPVAWARTATARRGPAACSSVLGQDGFQPVIVMTTLGIGGFPGGSLVHTLVQGEWICFSPFKVATGEVNSIKVVCVLKNVFHFWHWLDWFSKNYVNKNSSSRGSLCQPNTRPHGTHGR